MFVEFYIYVCVCVWTVQFQNGTPKRSETETFHSNWKNKTLTKTELTILISTQKHLTGTHGTLINQLINLKYPKGSIKHEIKSA